MNLPDSIFTISSPEAFKKLSLKVFAYQYYNVPVYKNFCDFLKKNPTNVTNIFEIPFLPIQFFKTHKILSKEKESKKIFTSSGTTGKNTSKHYIADLFLYQKSFITTFTSFFGSIQQYAILGLLPSYLEKGDSSLVYMVDTLIKKSNNKQSGFYLHNYNELIDKLHFLEKNKQKTLLIGVSYALLDLIEKQNFKLQHTIVMETGGMKGRRKEMVKEELHHVLKKGFGVTTIYSEYGMTELLSQAYSKGEGVFTSPPWMKILTRDTNDALNYVTGKTGGINVIDLANLYSCAFIATQDLGKKIDADSFKILGRFDTADIRGCNLLIE